MGGGGETTRGTPPGWPSGRRRRPLRMQDRVSSCPGCWLFAPGNLQNRRTGPAIAVLFRDHRLVQRLSPLAGSAGIASAGGQGVEGLGGSFVTFAVRRR